ncbi:ferrous iron transport protein B [uncultured Clostridium sp.]|jgi:ferrous iron transport protein B|uniref:ferrous iron transport protein B n=1 Tax=uncultured Clostridium sp. TaxID=59620 RepID=UPI002613172C|nr:ferrous iron transport protein B [uncultured Clostridium sp.]
MKTIALIGNPNVGKTTLFNMLTGSNQHVGNWAGVTVDKKEGFFEDIRIIDLPGIYAMDAFSNEEKVSKKFIEEGNVDAIVNIVDASNLDRNLYLTMQLKKFNKPIILVVNMIDVAEKKGISIDFESLEKNFNIKVIPLSATKSIGVEDLKSSIKNDIFTDYLDNKSYEFKDEEDLYKFIETKLVSTYNRDLEKSSTKLTERLDSIFLNPFLAYPLFILILYVVFQFTFKWVGQPLSDMMANFVDNVIMPHTTTLLAGNADWFKSLIVDGIISGVGGIVAFLPLIVSLYFCIFLLEDSGYMARVAFLMDSLMKKMGLSGKAFITMTIGFGCSVPSITSARTLESEKDRKLAALLAPLMSCNARLPVYVLFASVFFPDYRGAVVVSMYLIGIVVAFLCGLALKNTVFKKDDEPFIVELPEYKIPSARNVSKQIISKSKAFLIKAGTIIFAMSVLIWFLQSFNIHGLTDNVSDSFLQSIGSFIAPFFAPLGFGNWQASVSLLAGIMAKETVISSMEVIYSGDLHVLLSSHFTALSAYSFMVFVLLYTPCVSVIGVMKKEFGTKFTLFSFFFQLTLAWVCAFLIYNVGLLIF